MDDQTVFQNPNQAGSSAPPVQPVANALPQENPFTPQKEEVYTPSAPASPPPEENSFFSMANIIKILIGLGVVIFILFLIFKVIPGFFNKSSGQTTLSYWGVFEDSPVMDSIISDFERANPNIKIEYSKQDVKQYREKLTTRIDNGTGPDIFRFHNSWVPLFQKDLLPMSSDVITKDTFSKNFYQVASSDLIQNGAIYGIPLEIDTLSLYVNTQLLQAAGVSVPSSWQDFITDSRQLTVKDESGKIQTAGAALGTFDNINHASDILALLLVQNGANLNNLSSTPNQVSDALSFYTSFATGTGNVWDSTLDPSILAFAKGNLAMYFGYSWDYFAIKAANPNLNFDIFAVPGLSGKNQTIASYWVEGVSNKSKHQKEALLFMKYLAQKETEQKLYTAQAKTRFFGEPYANSSLAQSLKANPAIYPFVSQAPNALSTFFVSDTYDNAINSQMNTYLGNAVRSVLNGTSPESASDTLSKGAAQVLSQYGK